MQSASKRERHLAEFSVTLLSSGRFGTRQERWEEDPVTLLENASGYRREMLDVLSLLLSSSRLCLCKFFIFNHLEARGVEPLLDNGYASIPATNRNLQVCRQNIPNFW